MPEEWPSEGGPGQQLEGDEGGEGIAGKAEDGEISHFPEHHRGSRLDLQPPEDQFSSAHGNHLVENVLFPHGYAAGGDDEIRQAFIRDLPDF